MVSAWCSARPRARDAASCALAAGEEEELERRAAERWSALTVVFLFGGSQPRGLLIHPHDEGMDLFATVRESGRRACIFVVVVIFFFSLYVDEVFPLMRASEKRRDDDDELEGAVQREWSSFSTAHFP